MRRCWNEKKLYAKQKNDNIAVNALVFMLARSLPRMRRCSNGDYHENSKKLAHIAMQGKMKAAQN